MMFVYFRCLIFLPRAGEFLHLEVVEDCFAFGEVERRSHLASIPKPYELDDEKAAECCQHYENPRLQYSPH